jgi:hypothetical protein
MMGYAVLTVVMTCLRAGILPPLWAVDPYLRRYDAWDFTFQKPTLDAAFGVRNQHTNKQREIQQRNAWLRPFIIQRVLELSAAENKPIRGERPPRTISAKVAEEIRNYRDKDGNPHSGSSSITGRIVEEIFCGPENKDWKRFIEACLKHPPPKDLEKRFIEALKARLKNLGERLDKARLKHPPPVKLA